MGSVKSIFLHHARSQAQAVSQTTIHAIRRASTQASHVSKLFPKITQRAKSRVSLKDSQMLKVAQITDKYVKKESELSFVDTSNWKKMTNELGIKDQEIDHHFSRLLKERDPWGSISVQHFQFCVKEKSMYLRPGSEWMLLNPSLSKLAMLSAHCISPDLMKRESAFFCVTSILYTAGFGKPPFTEDPHTDSFEKSMIVPISNQCSTQGPQTNFFFNCGGSFRYEINSRQPDQIAIFPQRTKVTFRNLGVTSESVKKVYKRRDGFVEPIEDDDHHTINEALEFLTKNQDVPGQVLHCRDTSSMTDQTSKLINISLENIPGWRPHYLTI